MIRKNVELIEKTPEAKIATQSSFSDDCLRVYNIKNLDLFDPEWKLINTKPAVKKR